MVSGGGREGKGRGRERGRERGGERGSQEALVFSRDVLIDINMAPLVVVCDGKGWRERRGERGG